jgi:hypothetical protein
VLVADESWFSQADLRRGPGWSAGPRCSLAREGPSCYPANLDLRPFHGDHLTRVCLGPHDIQFKFGAGGTIAVWGHWELRDATGTLLDQAVATSASRDCYRVHGLLLATVVTSRIDPPRSFSLLFDNGLALSVFDDSGQYECCSIEPGGVVI